MGGGLPSQIAGSNRFYFIPVENGSSASSQIQRSQLSHRHGKF
jgi:hypothetical protein